MHINRAEHVISVQIRVKYVLSSKLAIYFAENSSKFLLPETLWWSFGSQAPLVLAGRAYSTPRPCIAGLWVGPREVGDGIRKR